MYSVMAEAESEEIDDWLLGDEESVRRRRRTRVAEANVPVPTESSFVPFTWVQALWVLCLHGVVCCVMGYRSKSLYDDEKDFFVDSTMIWAPESILVTSILGSLAVIPFMMKKSSQNAILLFSVLSIFVICVGEIIGFEFVMKFVSSELHFREDLTRDVALKVYSNSGGLSILLTTYINASYSMFLFSLLTISVIIFGVLVSFLIYSMRNSGWTKTRRLFSVFNGFLFFVVLTVGLLGCLLLVKDVSVPAKDGKLPEEYDWSTSFINADLNAILESGDFSHVAVLGVNWVDAGRPSSRVDEYNTFLTQMRDRGALIFHMCYNCPDCMDADSSVARPPNAELFRARELYPVVSGGVVSGNFRGYPTPFEPRKNQGDDLFPYGTRASGELRNHMSPYVTIEPTDFVLESSDDVFRVIMMKGIQVILFTGADACESLLYSEGLSLLKVLNYGWPGRLIVPVVDLVKTAYEVLFSRVDFDSRMNLWKSVIHERYGVDSLTSTEIIDKGTRR